MYFSPIGYDIVYDVVVFYDILSYIGVSKNGSKNREKNDIVPDVLPDIGYDVILICFVHLRNRTHPSKQ